MREIPPQREATSGRPPMPRIYRQHKQRVREEDYAKFRARKTRMELETDGEDMPRPQGPQYTARKTLCLPNFIEEQIVHGGDEGYQDVLRQFFPAAESNATERLVHLKSQLRAASTYDFWRILMEEMCDVFSAECGFVAKRMLVDDQDSAVEMPELGQPGSCLMGVAFYINHGQQVKDLHRDYRYTAYGTPCAHMKHDKVFIVPERMHEVITNNPNKMPWGKSEAFIGVPLSADGKAFAHFGMIWGTEGASKIQVSWNYIEMFCHSLEEMILQRILEGRGFAKDVNDPEAAKIIPLSAITASQSLKPYARSLSHELRTPMQGVVGMLDIMYSTVLDAISNQPSEKVRSVFQDLKNHIEVVQDSSKRAIEAADNVVHAYDMNMQMPEAPMTPDELDPLTVPSILQSPLVEQSPVKTNIDARSPMKRARSTDIAFHDGPPLKKMFAIKEADVFRIYCSEETAASARPSFLNPFEEVRTEERPSSRHDSPAPTSTLLNPLHRRVVTRDFLKTLLSDTLRHGHPISKVHTETELGEKIEVQTIGPRGEIHNTIVYLEVEVDVPEVIITEQQHLQFSLQKVIDNAIKFTESGSISLRVRVGKNDQKIEVLVVDTGCGIDEESKQNLFKPHFQQDSSISRARDGLGLSLFNAKAHIRKNLGGDVTLERSATDGPRRGSEFLIRLPMSAMDLDSDAPIVGTPPPSSHSIARPQWRDPSTSPSLQAKSPFLSLGFPPATTSNNLCTAARERRPSPPKASSRKRAACNANLAKDYPLNILIAEDNAINRNVAIGSLSKLGYSNTDITVAFDGAEAVERYKASLDKPPSERFNAILMDIWMPNMDGYEATKNIKELAQSVGDKITTIAVTADITSESVERAKAVGMEGFLAKPYKVMDIERLIIEHFSNMEGN